LELPYEEQDKIYAHLYGNGEEPEEEDEHLTCMNKYDTEHFDINKMTLGEENEFYECYYGWEPLDCA